MPSNAAATLVLAALCAVAAPPLVAAPARQLVHAGHLIDGVAETVRERVTVVVEGDRVVEIADGFRAPGAGETVIDLSGAWVLPGLIDLHVHLGSEVSPTAYIERFTENPADIALRAYADGMKTLRAGFTSVRNLGDSYNSTIALRDAVRRGLVVGPRIWSAGKSIATTGGHADPTNGWCDLIEDDPGPKEGVINGPDEAAKAVRQRYKDGADLIKITATGGVLSLARSPDAPQFNDAELAAIVATARDYGFAVAVHAHGTEGMKRAVRAGVTSVEHGSFMDEETMRLMKERGTWYVPTLSAGVFVGEKAKTPGYLPEIVRPKAEKVGAQIRETFARAVRSGVKVAFGTDSGVSPHGQNAQEFVYLVEGGMTPMQAIQAATSSAARVLGSEEVGVLGAGRYADLIAVEASPLEDVSRLRDVALVMKGGAIVKQR